MRLIKLSCEVVLAKYSMDDLPNNKKRMATVGLSKCCVVLKMLAASAF